MKSVSTSPTDSMPNTDITYFHSEQDSLSILPLHQTETDTFEIYMPAGRFLPSTQLEHNKDLFYNLLNTLLKRKKAEIILNEGISSNLICYILSLCLSFSIISIGIVYIIEGNFINLFTLYLFIGLFLYHFLLLLIVRLFGWTFNAKNMADEVIVNLWTYNILSGLLISPFVIAIFFVKSFAVIPLLKIVIFGAILLMIVKIIRWIEILITHRVSILYMILYLCALEIMPLLVLYKMVE